MDQKVPLEQILAAIPPQRRCELNQKISDAQLAEIAKDLINWRSVCTNLGISEGEENAIEEDNKEVDMRRYLHRAFVLLIYRDQLYVCVQYGRHDHTQTKTVYTELENGLVNCLYRFGSK